MNSLNNKIKSVGVSGTHLTVELLDGRSIRLPLTLFSTLAEASARQRAKWELCGADTGIHWPLLNYDLSVAGLLRGEPEAPGIRRAKKTAKYPAHKSGKTYALAEEADGGASVPASRSLQTATRIKSSSVVDTRVVYCGDNLEQLAKLPDACVDLIYIDPPFNSNRNYEVFWGESKEKRAFEDRHESTRAYIDYMRPRCVQLARVLKKTGSSEITAPMLLDFAAAIWRAALKMSGSMVRVVRIWSIPVATLAYRSIGASQHQSIDLYAARIDGCSLGPIGSQTRITMMSARANFREPNISWGTWALRSRWVTSPTSEVTIVLGRRARATATTCPSTIAAVFEIASNAPTRRAEVSESSGNASIEPNNCAARG